MLVLVSMRRHYAGRTKGLTQGSLMEEADGKIKVYKSDTRAMTGFGRQCTGSAKLEQHTGVGVRGWQRGHCNGGNEAFERQKTFERSDCAG